MAATTQALKAAAQAKAGGTDTCHAPIKAFHAGGKHQAVACSSCHARLAGHDTNEKLRPLTRSDRAVSGGCRRRPSDMLYLGLPPVRPLARLARPLGPLRADTGGRVVHRHRLPLHASGLRRGPWPVPGGGYEAWTGTWDIVRPNLGPAWVTTPLGTFEAMKFLNVNTSTDRMPATRPLRLVEATWTVYIGFVENVGIVRVGGGGSGVERSNFVGDGFADGWSYDELTYLATPAPEPASPSLLVAGLALLLGQRGAWAGDRAAGARKNTPAIADWGVRRLVGPE